MRADIHQLLALLGHQITVFTRDPAPGHEVLAGRLMRIEISADEVDQPLLAVADPSGAWWVTKLTEHDEVRGEPNGVGR